MKRRLLYALFGVLATLVGVATGHFVAALLNPASSPVLAVGSQVIDLTPTPMKEWAIRQFGDRDKAILIGSVMAGVLLLAAVAGVLARRSLRLGAGLLLVLVAVAGFTAMNRPTAELVDVVPSVAAAISGVAALWLLDRTARPAATRAPAPTSKPAEHPMEHLMPGADPAATAPSRRGVLVATGALALAAAALGGAGRYIGRVRTRLENISLPAPADPAPAFPTGLESQFDGITPFRVSNEDFYRVDTRLDVPIVDQDEWTLTIDGDVDREVTLTYDDILAMDLIERDITLTCVSNSVGGKYVGGARWLGVRLTDLLDLAGVGTAADQIFATDVDGMTISTPLALATDGRDAMLAVGMNGEVLPREHGFPARVVIPGLYGFISATKWVTRLTLTTYEEKTAYWTERDWATDAPIKISSRIDTPKALAQLEPGEVVIGGVAWAQQNGGVATVQVRIDGGGWQDAELGPSAGNDYWRQWFYRWDARDAGQHTVAARVVDGNGNEQATVRATPFPEGASGIQELIVTVT
ncbi:molybdopterin-dependent oxidoreductase [Nocardioides sp.]|uniref:molybdopterin-dependent oxidoreductase n=1 Tax=Nocardioides sp. TaxID=35761 RepID=UPI001A1B8AAA|nr:molybdopterin-dependent oxidoreductase [Nocardioides sp.]MBJ7356337.1 molybdopterin-dependent oxidoreductase [Nocardioides sp.]